MTMAMAQDHSRTKCSHFPCCGEHGGHIPSTTQWHEADLVHVSPGARVSHECLRLAKRNRPATQSDRTEFARESLRGRQLSALPAVADMRNYNVIARFSHIATLPDKRGALSVR